MRIEIEIPQAYEKYFNQDKFKYSFDNFLKAYNSELLRIVKQGGVSDDVCEWRIVDRPNNLPIYNTSCGKIRLQCATGVDIYCNGCGKKIKVIGGGVYDD